MPNKFPHFGLKSPREKQQERAWYIFRLRGLWSLVGILKNVEAVQDIRDWIDRALVDEGAQPESPRQARRKELRDAWFKAPTVEDAKAPLEAYQKEFPQDFGKAPKFNRGRSKKPS